MHYIQIHCDFGNNTYKVYMFIVKYKYYTVYCHISACSRFGLFDTFQYISVCVCSTGVVFKKITIGK